MTGLEDPTARAELIARFGVALLRGDATLGELFSLSPQQVSEGWRQVVSALEARRSSDDLVALIQMLGWADPEFASFDFLLGLAHSLNGDARRAAHHIERQLQHPSRLHLRESAILLAEIRGAAPTEGATAQASLDARSGGAAP
jgi:hypothetical protein